MRKFRVFAVLLGLVLLFFTLALPVSALTNEEMLRKLDEKFIQGEISEENYNRLRAKYRDTSQGKVQIKPATKPATQKHPAEVFREDFETGDISSWRLIKNYQNNLAMGVVDGGASGSKSAYEIRRDATSADCAFYLQSPFIPVKPGKIYELQFEQKNTYDTSKMSCGSIYGLTYQGKDNCPCGIRWYDADRKEILPESGVPGFGSPNPQWHKVVKPGFKPPEKAVFARIQFGLDWPDVFGGKYWTIDNIVLVEK